MSDVFNTYLPWFILREIPSLGNVTIKKLVSGLGSPGNIFEASDRDLELIGGIDSRIIKNIRRYKDFSAPAAKELKQVLTQGGLITVLSDPDFPPMLRMIADPPCLLTYFGSLDSGSPCLSVVGSRSATSYGLSTAKNLSFKLARNGFQIVSGLARGIDTMAHEGALSAGGRTVAVLGSGLNKVYPKENRKLFDTIGKTGTIFSEFKINADPAPFHFPIRNRIIAGLSCGSVVVEAARKSGSLITARLAGEYNREVFAVPGSIKSAKSQGTHFLLKQGARLVETEKDILDELGQFIHHEDKKEAIGVPVNPKSVPSFKNPPATEPLLAYLDPYPIHIDLLVEKSGLPFSTIASRLLELELQGMVTRHPGNYYSTSEETID